MLLSEYLLLFCGRRLRAAKALLVGGGGLGAEGAKNIVLAGIRSLTLLDHQVASPPFRDVKDGVHNFSFNVFGHKWRNTSRKKLLT